MLKDHTILHTFEPLVMHQMGFSQTLTQLCVEPQRLDPLHL